MRINCLGGLILVGGSTASWQKKTDEIFEKAIDDESSKNDDDEVSNEENDE